MGVKIELDKKEIKMISNALLSYSAKLQKYKGPSKKQSQEAFYLGNWFKGL